MFNLENDPRVSVIVPVYNGEKYLARCLDSLLAQTLPFYEIIVVDDGSTDSSGKLCDLYADNNNEICVLHQKNQGVSSARNAGIETATGEYIAFADSDDWVSPVFNEILCSVAQDTDADIVVGEMKRVDGNDPFGAAASLGSDHRLYTADEYMDIFLRIQGNRCVHYPWGKLYKRGVLEKDLFPSGIANGEDAVAFFKMLTNAQRIVEVTALQPLYAYYLNSESVTGVKFGNSYFDLPKVWDEISDLARIRCPNYLEKVQYNQRRVWFTLVCDSILHGTEDTDIQFKNDIKEWRSRCRTNCRSMLMSPMVARRKVLFLGVTYLYPLVRFLYRLWN